DEVAAGAGPGPGRAREHRAVHRRVRRRAEAAGQGEDQGRAGGVEDGTREAGSLPPVPFSIAQVTPYAWEQHHEVNRFVERVSDELCQRGHRVVVVTPSDSRELIREGRAAVRRSADDPDAVFAQEGSAQVLAVGQSIPFPSS